MFFLRLRLINASFNEWTWTSLQQSEPYINHQIIRRHFFPMPTSTLSSASLTLSLSPRLSPSLRTSLFTVLFTALTFISMTAAEPSTAIHLALTEEALNGTVLVDLSNDRQTYTSLKRKALSPADLRFELLSSYFSVCLYSLPSFFKFFTINNSLNGLLTHVQIQNDPPRILVANRIDRETLCNGAVDACVCERDSECRLTLTVRAFQRGTNELRALITYTCVYLLIFILL